jgi:hypothetical protein
MNRIFVLAAGAAAALLGCADNPTYEFDFDGDGWDCDDRDATVYPGNGC